MKNDVYGTIYHITNLQNGKVYIGQTTKDYHKRCRKHISSLEHSTHYNRHLTSAYHQYGHDSFITGSLYHAYTQEELDGAEDYYMWFYDSLNQDKGYNLKGAGAKGHHSASTRQKMSRTKIGVPRPRTTEHSLLIGASFAKPYPSLIHKETHEIIPSGINLCRLCEDRGLNSANMHHVISGKRPSCSGWMVLVENT